VFHNSTPKTVRDAPKQTVKYLVEHEVIGTVDNKGYWHMDHINWGGEYRNPPRRARNKSHRATRKARIAELKRRGRRGR
jgi:hypothetical protein